MTRGTATGPDGPGSSSITTTADSCAGFRLNEAFCNQVNGHRFVDVEPFITCPYETHCISGACVSTNK